MSYPWANRAALKTLKAGGGNDVLVIETDFERAEVAIKKNEIWKVDFHHQGIRTTLKKKDRHHIVVGDHNTRRDVYHFLKPGGPAPSLRLGMTKHRGNGTWSSLPHDFELHTEPDFEEVFFYLLQGGPQRAIQVGKGLWCDGTPVDGVWPVRDRSWSTIPMGYHPVVGEPGVNVSYIWAYLAKKAAWEKI